MREISEKEAFFCSSNQNFVKERNSKIQRRIYLILIFLSMICHFNTQLILTLKAILIEQLELRFVLTCFLSKIERGNQNVNSKGRKNWLKKFELWYVC